MVHIEEVQKAATTNTKWKKNLKYHFSCSSSDKNKEPCTSHVWKVLITSLPHLKYALNVIEPQAKKF